MTKIEPVENLGENHLARAWAELQSLADHEVALRANANRMAFADPEFMLRRETRGIRLQLEMLKPDLNQMEQGIDHTIVVFGSARFLAPEDAQTALVTARSQGDAKQIALAERRVVQSRFYEQARLFARMVADYSAGRPREERLFIATGGGPGIMEAANRGAHDRGALSVGLNIALPHEQHPNAYITPSLSFKFHYFALRKMHFMIRAKALVAFPGGFGTLDELFEVITLVQTGKAKAVPIVLFGSDYWKRLLSTDVMMEEGVISAEDLRLFTYVDDAEAAWEVIRAFYDLQ